MALIIGMNRLWHFMISSHNRLGTLILFSQQLDEADDSLHYRMNTVAGFTMNLDNSNSTSQRVWFERGLPNTSIAEREATR